MERLQVVKHVYIFLFPLPRGCREVQCSDIFLLKYNISMRHPCFCNAYPRESLSVYAKTDVQKNIQLCLEHKLVNCLSRTYLYPS